MANSPMSDVIQHLRTAVLLRDGAGLTDGQLLEDYLRRHERAALAALIRRHGPMVWGVCRRVLRNDHDAEDAFQATFLVLVRKASSVLPREMVANWLYGVAHHTALKARATTAKRRVRERQVTQMPEPAATEPHPWHDLQALLDQEVSRLPDKYRVAIVLCDLERKTRKEAARQLSVAEGTLAAWLARGRVMLAKRLARHGLGVSGGALGVLLAQNITSAAVPTSALSNAIEAASLCAAGQAVATGVISTKVAALTEEVLNSMLKSKLKPAVVVVLAIAALGIAVGALPYRTKADESPPQASKSALPTQDQGNLKETVLALEKRMWEAHTKQDVDAFKNLLADDFVGTDVRGDSYTKEGVLRYVATNRVVDPVMKNARVVVLNTTSAIVTYEIRYRVASHDGQKPETVVPRQATTAWAMRDGKWWYVYCEAKELGEDGRRWKGPALHETSFYRQVVRARLEDGVDVERAGGELMLKTIDGFWTPATPAKGGPSTKRQ
jgi:RNA polymerase sigma factor (sigma-70 family)